MLLVNATHTHWHTDRASLGPVQNQLLGPLRTQNITVETDGSTDQLPASRFILELEEQLDVMSAGNDFSFSDMFKKINRFWTWMIKSEYFCVHGRVSSKMRFK